MKWGFVACVAEMLTVRGEGFRVTGKNSVVMHNAPHG